MAERDYLFPSPDQIGTPPSGYEVPKELEDHTEFIRRKVAERKRSQTELPLWRRELNQILNEAEKPTHFDPLGDA